VNLLLDTHIALWAVEDNPRLPAHARALLLAPGVRAHVSVASLWEIAIKHALGRRGAKAMPMSAAQAQSFFVETGFIILPIKAEHVVTVESLERHHEDPFDRLLIATALTEPLRLVTHDATLSAYSDTIIVT
jgi:PIN domain nuclease of toxin-antitoxin system